MAMTAVTLKGCVKVWFRDRGWGLIETIDGTEYFAHTKDLAPELKQMEKPDGQQVEFETIPGPHSKRWPKALWIRVTK